MSIKITNNTWTYKLNLSPTSTSSINDLWIQTSRFFVAQQIVLHTGVWPNEISTGVTIKYDPAIHLYPIPDSSSAYFFTGQDLDNIWLFIKNKIDGVKSDGSSNNGFDPTGIFLY